MNIRKNPLAVIFLIVFIDLVGFGIIIPLSPYFATYVGADAFEVGLLMSSFSLTQFLFNPFWGKLSDKYGRRPILLISLLGASLSYLIFAFSTTYFMLLFARSLAGFFGANISTAMAYVADVTDPKDRSKSMGLVGAAFGLGFVVGPAIGGGLSYIGFQISEAPPFGYGFPALGASLICFINFLWAYKVLKESLKPNQKPAPRINRFSLIRKYLSMPVLGILIFMSFVMTFAMAHMESTLGLYVEKIWNLDVTEASFAFAYIGVIIVFTQGFLIRKILPKFGEPKLLFAGTILACLGFLGIATSTSIYTLVFAVTLIGIGSGLFNPSNMGSMSLSAPKEEQGLILGVGQSFSALGRILGPASGGWFYKHHGDQSPFFIASGIVFLGLTLLFASRFKLPNSQKK